MRGGSTCAVGLLLLLAAAGCGTSDATPADAGHGKDGNVGRADSGNIASGDAGSLDAGAIPDAGSPPTVNYYVAQASTGTGDGSSCANAKAASWFNSSANWGTGSGQIGPGTVVGLCGTITSPLTARSSGTSAKPITIYWEPGASLSEPYCPGQPGSGPGCFNTNSQSYLTLNGGSNGSIVSTANGTNLANQQNSPHGIYAIGCTGCTIENLNISDMYVEAPGSGDCTASDAAAIYASGSDLTIADNTFEQEQVGIDADWSSTDTNDSIDGNTFDHVGTPTNWITNVDGGGNIGPILFYDNTMDNLSAWDTSGDCYHEDGIHCWDSPGYTPSHYQGIYIYDNRFSGLGVNGTAFVFMEGGSGSGATICADSKSPIYVFNNVMTVSKSVTNGRAEMEIVSGEPREYNNTIIGADSGGGTCDVMNSDAVNATSENNALSTCGTFRYDNQSNVFASGRLNYNVYENGGGNAWICGSNYIGAGGFSAWQSCADSTLGAGSGAEGNSKYSSANDLDSNGSPEAGSKVLNAGTNLSSLCAGHLIPLCSNINGAARPKTGNWNAGAY